MGWNLLYILGNSDMVVSSDSGVGKSISKGSFREDTLRVYERLSSEDYKIEGDTIVLPDMKISFPMFCEFLKKGIKDNRELPYLYLFVSNQEPPHPQDTIHVAKILKEHFLRKKFKNKLEVCIKEIKKNPASYEDMSEYFTGFVEEEGRRLKNATINYLQLTTGTPAMCISLLLSLRGVFAPLKIFYLMKVENGKPPKVEESRFLRNLLFSEVKAVMKQLIRSYSYVDVLDILKSSRIPDCSLLENLLEIMRLRRLFDFEEAKFRADRLPESFQHKMRIVRYLSDILEGESIALLKASFEEMDIYMKKKEYHSACAALFNFTDLLNSLVFSRLKEMGLIGDEDEKCSFPDKMERISRFSNKEGVKELKEYKIWLSIFEDEEVEKKVHNLREIRNKGPFAHDISRFPEEEVGNLNMVYERIKGVIREKLRSSDDLNFYDAINEVIEEEIDRL